MTWEQKVMAIEAVSQGAYLRMRKPGDWYIHTNIERKEGGCLSSGLTSGKTPEEAVEQWWSWATDPKYYLISKAYSPERLAIKWNGFMWEKVEEAYRG